MVFRKTILYVEDDPDGAVLLSRALQREQLPCNLQIVSNVLGARSYLAGTNPYG
jgi:hypothetical protein